MIIIATEALADLFRPGFCSERDESALWRQIYPIRNAAKVFHITRNLQAGVLELNSAGKWPSWSRIGHP